MKKSYLLIVICSCISFAFKSDEYQQIMKKNVEKLYLAESTLEFQELANTFDRIALAEKDQWHPHYYTAYTYIQMSHLESVPLQQDKLLDKALYAVEEAQKMEANNSELLTLEGYIHMLRIPIDPASRGQQYSGMSFQALQRAAAIDESNPRALLILSRMQMGTAQFFGSDLTEACGTLQKSIKLFESAMVQDPLAPAWGKTLAKQSQEACK